MNFYKVIIFSLILSAPTWAYIGIPLVNTQVSTNKAEIKSVLRSIDAKELKALNPWFDVESFLANLEKMNVTKITKKSSSLIHESDDGSEQSVSYDIETLLNGRFTLVIQSDFKNNNEFKKIKLKIENGDTVY